jgi:AraC-like DNA-binding protein
MAVLLDTSAIRAADRHEVFRSAMLEASGATRIDLETPPEGVEGRMTLCSLGPSRIFTAASSGMAMTRDRRTARGASPEAVAVAVHGAGIGRHQMGDRQRLVRTGDVMIVDVTRPFDFSWSGWGSSTSLQVPISELGMPVEAVQRAATRLESSPLYRIVSRYLVELTDDAERLSAAPTAAALGEVSTQLIRALLSGAVDDAGGGRDVLEHTLLTQVRVYVDQHLRDPALDADSVAASLAISRRQLYRTCTLADFSLEQYIIGRRLENAKSDLASPVGRTRTIGAVAYSWGFKDPTHFTRRFRAAYGLLPSDWRRLSVDEHGRHRDEG